MENIKINIGKQKFQIGEEVTIKWKKKNYEGKSVRRVVIDSIMEQWRKNSLANLETEHNLNFQYDFSSTKETLKEYSDIISGKKACEGSIFKRHQESKEWFKSSIEALDNFIGAVVIGVEASCHHASPICPFHISYITDRHNNALFIYKVLVHGICDPKGKKNHVCFEIELFDEDMKRVKE